MRADAIVVGGSFAGLSAAIHIARACRTVCVIDAGRPRNRFADAAHGVFGHDGSDPRRMLAEATAQLSRYPTVEMIADEVTRARAADGGFEVALAGGGTRSAARLVLAFGISDILPELPGLAERWGKSVLHCPYCHGFEIAGRRLGVFRMGPDSVYQALVVADWGPVTLYLNGADAPDGDTAALAARGVTIEPAPIVALRGEGSSLTSILLDGGRESPADALYLMPQTRLNSPIAEELGCALDDGPFGPVIRTDSDKQTTVSGVYAAGDIARAPQNASWAAGDGVTAGIALHHGLVFDPAAG